MRSAISRESPIILRILPTLIVQLYRNLVPVIIWRGRHPETMLAKVKTAAVVGLDAQEVEVEVDILSGLPAVKIAGK